MRYIKTNVDNNIIDLFHECQESKMDGTEIEFDENEGYKINGKSMSNEYGVPVFDWIDSEVVERTEIEISSDVDAVARLKQQYLALFPSRMVMCFANKYHTWEEIQSSWLLFKSGASGWTTITQVEAAWIQAQRFLDGEI